MLHYLKFVALIVLIGIVIGSVAGTWLGLRVTALFGDFFHFPFLVFAKAPDLYVDCRRAERGGGRRRRAARAARGREAAARRRHAAARPAAFTGVCSRRRSARRMVSQPTLMMLRNIARHPVRAAFTALGMALATAILVVSLFTRDTMEQLIDVTYFLADRQDATISFVEKRPSRTSWRRWRDFRAFLPPSRSARCRSGSGMAMSSAGSRSAAGRADADLSRIIDVDLRPVVLPETGSGDLEHARRRSSASGSEIPSKSTCWRARGERYRCRSLRWSRTISASGA